MTGLPARPPLTPASPPVEETSRRLARLVSQASETPSFPHRSGPRQRLVCLVQAADARRGLPSEFCPELHAQLPEVEFVTEPPDRVDAVWIMGCPASDFDSVAALREAYPAAYLLVTSRDLSARRATALEQAGADCALNWVDNLVGVRRALSGELKPAPAAR